jgi:hypothetical protein
MTSPLPAHPPTTDLTRNRARGGGRTGTVVALVVGAAALAVLAPLAGLFLWLYGGPDVDEPRAVAEQFLRHVEAGDDGAAYQLLCARTQQRITVEAFTEAVQRPARPASHTLGRAAFHDEPGNRASVDADLTDRTGAVRSISLALDRTGEGWRICDDNFG